MANIVVVGPHPDDQELGMGGTIARLGSQGLPSDSHLRPCNDLVMVADTSHKPETSKPQARGESE